MQDGARIPGARASMSASVCVRGVNAPVMASLIPRTPFSPREAHRPNMSVVRSPKITKLHVHFTTWVLLRAYRLHSRMTCWPYAILSLRKRGALRMGINA